MTSHGERWNHNIRYHRVVFEALPSTPPRALDVGCGEGLLARAAPGEIDYLLADSLVLTKPAVGPLLARLQ